MLSVFPVALALIATAAEANTSYLAESDPRVELVRLQAADRLEEALEAVDNRLDAANAGLDPVGAQYLRGHLLSSMRRNQEAADSFAAVISSDSLLSQHASIRLAELQENQGFTPAAAALATEVLTQSAPRSLVARALAILARTLETGGDCRLLGRLASVRLRTAERRQLDLIRARCGLRQRDKTGRSAAAGRDTLVRLVTESYRDLVGLLAADLLYAELDHISETQRPTVLKALAQAFHQHRRFDRAVPLLATQIPNPMPPVRNNSTFRTHFQLGRGLFWQGQFLNAADSYGQLAERSTRTNDRSVALYHRSRALELAGRWTEAKPSFIATHDANPEGDYAGAGLLGSFRLRLRSGEEEIALKNYAAMSASTKMRSERSLAALFLSSSHLSQSRVNNVRQWLNDAGLDERTIPTLYWRGRLAELEAEPTEAVEHYVEALERDYFHPLAQLGLARLDHGELRSAALSLGERLAAEGKRLNAAWILLGSQHEAGISARDQLEADLLRRNRRRQLAPTSTVPVEDWPLFNQPTATAESLLLSLGVWSEGGSAVQRAFPASQPNLAFTAALELQRAGKTQEGLLIAESLAKSIPRGTPPRLVPTAFRRALYPFAYRFLIEQAARHFKVDPLLLAAIIREESRFKPTAASSAAARGLTQFIIPTAEKYAPKIGFEDLGPDDLDKPAVSVALGAAYLQELTIRFDGRPERILAAYNAGEDQAETWGRHCYTRDPAEYITKVGFSETREYVIKVMRSYAQYRDLYLEGTL